MVSQITSINQRIVILYDDVKTTEGLIEKAMHVIFGNETEGVSLYNYYSQMKRVGED